MIQALAHAIVPAIFVSVLLGFASFASIALTLRIWRLDGNSGLRFAIWFVALIALALIVPLFFASSSWVSSRPMFSNEPAPASSALLLARSAPHVTEFSHAPVLSVPPERDSTFDLRYVVLLIWGGGVVILLGRTALGLIRLHLLMRSAPVLEVRTISRGPVRVVAADLFDVPAAAGYRNPAVILPADVLSLERETDLEHVILHELEHLRRFDDVTSLLQALCICVLWFNPFAYAIARRLSVEREMACDEAVVADTGKIATYAATLWKLASRSNAVHPTYVSAFSTPSAILPRLLNLRAARPKSQRFCKPFALALAAVLQTALIGVAVASPARLLPADPITASSRVTLADGDVLVVGGRSADGSPSHFAQLYDARGGRLALIRTNVARWGPTLTPLLEGDVLVLGGVADSGVSSDAEIYVTKERRFHAIAPMAFPRVGQSATLLLDGRVLVASGERGRNEFVDATEIFDPSNDRFTRVADGDDRLNQNAVLVDRGSVLLYGGRHCVIVYDPRLRGYHSSGRVVARTPGEIVTKLKTGQLVRHMILRVAVR